jgi:NADPH2:quinone reductase
VKALICTKWGGPDDLRIGSLPAPPQPGPGQILVGPAAFGVNYADLVLIAGNYRFKPPFPFAPGLEIAGTVAAVGPGQTRFRVGDRAMAYVAHGGYAEQVVANEGSAFPIPPEMSDAEAAAIPTTFGPSYVALVVRAALKPGETLLVLGAAGGVGLAAVQIGKKLGARVIAAASSAEKLDVAARSGADALINYSSEDLRERVLELTAQQGADVIFDPVGGDLFNAAMRCVAFAGRIVVLGFVSGSFAAARTNVLLVKNAGVLGSAWAGYCLSHPEVVQACYSELVRWFQDGAIKPYIGGTFRFEDGAQALKAVAERRAIGKLVLLRD